MTSPFYLLPLIVLIYTGTLRIFASRTIRLFPSNCAATYGLTNCSAVRMLICPNNLSIVAAISSNGIVRDIRTLVLNIMLAVL